MRAPSKLTRIFRLLAAGGLVGGVAIGALQAGLSEGAWADAQPYYSWGFGGFGELGNGTNNNSLTPGAVALPGGAPRDIAAGEATGYAITSTGHIDAWGFNNDGELGNGSTTTTNAPVQVSMPGGVTPNLIAGGQLDGYAGGSDGKSTPGATTRRVSSATVRSRRTPTYRSATRCRTRRHRSPSPAVSAPATRSAQAATCMGGASTPPARSVTARSAPRSRRPRWFPCPEGSLRRAWSREMDLPWP
jgi:hypothetical protein